GPLGCYSRSSDRGRIRLGSVAPAGTKAQRAAALHEWICRVIDVAADTHRLPSPFLTRVLWQESRFRADVTSRAGAAGVAQFMPGTAAERGLADPYDPDSAIGNRRGFWPNSRPGSAVSALP